MVKTIRLLLVVLLMATSWVAVGCSSDDDDNGGRGSSSSLVGTWRYTYESSYGEGTAYTLITFKSNGTGVLYEKDSYYEDREPFNYVYSKSTKELTVYYDDGETESYTVLNVSSSTLQLLNPDGYVTVLKRVE